MWCSSTSLFCVDIRSFFPAPFFCRNYSFPIDWSWCLCRNQLVKDVWLYIWVSYDSITVFDNYNFKNCIYILRFFFFFAYLMPLTFHTHLKIGFSISEKRGHWDFDRNLIDFFEEHWHMHNNKHSNLWTENVSFMSLISFSIFCCFKCIHLLNFG